ncbi:MAG: YlbF family regulator [Lactobacillales bacterium]|jgi:cell fate (sporulation/competence/biofilm development) regulator YmcA (YheA/YmcA/DUF963 family)|nr:YlbF family regulator [Lactobacillales bacterium]
MEEEKVQQALEELLKLIDEDPAIREFKEIQAVVTKNSNLTELVEEMKKAQQDAVKFAHYGKPEAQRQALALADQKKEAFDTHPLVVTYRERLIEANDLLQHITKQIESEVNEAIEKETIE